MENTNVGIDIRGDDELLRADACTCMWAWPAIDQFKCNILLIIMINTVCADVHIHYRCDAISASVSGDASLYCMSVEVLCSCVNELANVEIG
jgi:hypothetical protein